ncbi:hypothetical protein FIM02_01320 [SAR202 cluster bacterium AD-802-E10_MRT_200m]|nr:hypothetical protein [SAR202 cluster bacterium AD-802-E10_MRT_200m]MQF82785.1 hypothetical protein [SAR202 cluster bacterium AD-802-E10_MRT_200m]
MAETNSYSKSQEGNVAINPDLTYSPFEQTYIALDLETTGLNPAEDSIIEVGMVRFRNTEILQTFSSYVNPHRKISPFIENLTGISQEKVDSAPEFDQIITDIKTFTQGYPIVGHSVNFDLAFLAKQGIEFPSHIFDTLELAPIILPNQSYSLINLASTLKVPHNNPHRAMADAEVTGQVLIALLETALMLQPEVLDELYRLATISGWSFQPILQGLAAESRRRFPHLNKGAILGGLDNSALEQRLAQRFSKRKLEIYSENHASIELSELLDTQSPLTSIIPNFEVRKEQIEMLKAVNYAFETDQHLLVEAGTGVGKTMAYLIPAAVFSHLNNCRVVVATNTINLQEQLVQKDLPTVSKLLIENHNIPDEGLHASTLKGRDNYLCLRRWEHLRSSYTLTVDDTKLLSKILVWIQETSSGDRSDIRMNRSDQDLWNRISAQGSPQCPLLEGPCFLKAAREKAESTEILVVNHALLLADLERGGGLIPEYDQLIVDEAHHLENVATQQFGFRTTQREIQETLESLMDSKGITNDVINAYRTSTVSSHRKQATQTAIESMINSVLRAQTVTLRLFTTISQFIQNSVTTTNGLRKQKLIDQDIRQSDDWSLIKNSWENASVLVTEVALKTEEVHHTLDGLRGSDLLNYDVIRSELISRFESLQSIHDHLEQFILHPDTSKIYWVEDSNGLSLHAAPFDVASILQDVLFSKKKSVILTSATLATAGSFEPIRQRLGLQEPNELILGSPFNYNKAALLCLPQDIPEPSDEHYEEFVINSIVDLAQVTRGHSMILFTSHSSLRSVGTKIKSPLETQGIRVLLQGVNGTPRHLLEEFRRDPQTVLLGTSSFWEGVDLGGEDLKLLIIARLPFEVPTEPIFAARSKAFSNPFQDYAIPQAILRLRQGFGRLIRSRSDRGVVVILDRRITSKAYGSLFLRSLPECTVVRDSLKKLPKAVQNWLGK